MQTAKNRIIETSRRDFKVNKLLFVITNLVLFIMEVTHLLYSVLVVDEVNIIGS